MSSLRVRCSGVAVLLAVLLAVLPAAAGAAQAPASGQRIGARELGLEIGVLPPGPANAITDVAGVRVGQVTLVEGDDLRTGVTAILAHGGNLFQEKVPAAVHVANAFGKAAGLLQVRELGTLETPIVLTNTLSVGTAVEAVVAWALRQPGNEDIGSVNAVVGETNDGWLNDIRAQAVRAEDVVAAIESASTGPPAEGAVGAGAGTVAFGFKGGIGTASRRLPASLGGWTVGVLVQSNFGGVLTVDGLPLGEALGRVPWKEQIEAGGQLPPPQQAEEGSCMIVVATDAPLSARNLERLAARAPLGLARTGSFVSNGSGDFVIAFSTARRVPHASEEAVETMDLLRDDRVSPLFLAVVEATEEAIVDSLLLATTTTGFRGRTVEAVPLEPLRAMIRARDHGAPAADAEEGSPPR